MSEATKRATADDGDATSGKRAKGVDRASTNEEMCKAAVLASEPGDPAAVKSMGWMRGDYPLGVVADEPCPMRVCDFTTPRAYWRS